jgi:hypothetical protein
MAAPNGPSETFFKVGRTSDISRRIGEIQTGCPLKLRKVWALTVWASGPSQILEKQMHGWLAPYHSHGEWFRMDQTNPGHKEAMNKVFADALVAMSSVAEGAKWRQMDVEEIRRAVAELLQDMAAGRKRIDTGHRRKALVKMVTEGRKIL